MTQEYIYAPHHEFFIDKRHREERFEMDTFHLHKKYEIYYQINGQRNYFIDSSAYLVSEGDLVIIDKDVPHKTGSPDDKPHSRFVINFTDESVISLKNQVEAIDVLDIFECKFKVMHLSKKERSVTENLLNRMYKLSMQNTREACALRKLSLCELLIYIREYIREQTASAPKPQELVHPLVSEVVAYVTDHYAEDLTLERMAGHFEVSTYYLSRLFKQVNRISLSEYINSVRIGEARKLLDSTSAPVAEVARLAGYHTTTHFTRIFRASVGMAPQEYRKAYQNKS